MSYSEENPSDGDDDLHMLKSIIMHGGRSIWKSALQNIAIDFQEV